MSSDPSPASQTSDCKSVDIVSCYSESPWKQAAGVPPGERIEPPADRSIEEHSDANGGGVVQRRAEGGGGGGGERWETPMTTATGATDATVRRIVNTSGAADAGAIPVSPSADRCGGRATRVPSTSGRCVGRALRVWRGEA